MERDAKAGEQRLLHITLRGVPIKGSPLSITVLPAVESFRTQMGRSGKADGQFSNPQGVAISREGMMYVCDTSNRRVQVFNAQDQSFLHSFGETTHIHIRGLFNLSSSTIPRTHTYNPNDPDNPRVITRYSRCGVWAVSVSSGIDSLPIHPRAHRRRPHRPVGPSVRSRGIVSAADRPSRHRKLARPIQQPDETSIELGREGDIRV